MPQHSGTGYRSGRGFGVGAFAPRRTQQGVPLQPVPMTGQTGEPQTPIWSIADKIMASTYAEEIDAEEGIEDDDEDPVDDPRIADWGVWNTPRYDVERYYQGGGGEGMSEGQNLPPRRSEVHSRGYLESMSAVNERLLRQYIRVCLHEVNAISTGGASGVDVGKIRGVVTPLGTGPKHPKSEDRRGSKKRNKKRLERGASSFGGGKFAVD